MRKTLFLFAVVFLALAGCGENVDLRGTRGGGDQGGLSDEEYQRLTELNILQNDNILARKAVYGRTFVPASLSEKVSKLAKMIGDNCAGDLELPEEEMSGATNDQLINGAQCPIAWLRTRTYNPATRSFGFNDDFVANSNDFINLSPITRRQVQGSISAVINGGTKTISGTIMIMQFQVKGKGPVKGSIQLHSSYVGNSGSGQIALNMTVYGKSTHSAAISWEVPKFDPKYSIDGKPVEPKTFEEIFSAFELTKIMANSMKMR